MGTKKTVKLTDVELEIQREEANEAVASLRLKASQEKLEKLRAQLRELCPHDESKDDSHYFSGSYYDRACTTHNLRCVRCNKLLKTWDETHSWYG